MQSRGVLLTTNGWPFIIRYWLENFKTWENKVDKLYILCDNGNSYDVKIKTEYIKFLKNRIYRNHKIVLLNDVDPWPQSYASGFYASKEDLLLIMHDDCYINNPKIIDVFFSMAAKGYCVTPLHEIYSPKNETEAYLKEKYPGVFPLTEKGGYSFLLYLIFISRENMSRTSLSFVPWEHPQYAINHICGDTGFKFMLDLLDNKVKIYGLPEFHSQSPTKGDYIHIGGMGTSIPNVINGTLTTHKGWGKEFKYKIELMKEALTLDTYTELPEYRNFVKKRLEEIHV